MSAPRVFDYHHYEFLNRARGDVVKQLLGEIADPLHLRTAVDVGCGAGYFSGLLQSLGLQVTGVDGRKQNAEEAARRVPGVKFHAMNAEDFELRSLGTFDLVFCFGLLYHLENPLLAIRHLRSMSNSLLLIESVVYPGEEPVMGLVDESSFEDQGLHHFAFYPTEACLIKMMYRAGFSHVYGLVMQPEHPEYHGSGVSPKNRTLLAASLVPLSSRLLTELAEPVSAIEPWVKKPNANQDTISKLRQFAEKPLPQKVKSIKRFVRGK